MKEKLQTFWKTRELSEDMQDHLSFIVMTKEKENPQLEMKERLKNLRLS